MNFNISAFTHVGTNRTTNQDCILVNGYLLNEGEIHLKSQEYLLCFVADGVGGNKGGDFASYFVLRKINEKQENLIMDTIPFLKNINKSLIDETKDDIYLNGCGTTLSGFFIDNGIIKMIHAGDSEIWLMRNEMFFKITKDQVLDETVRNSPITSYFGGIEDNLELDLPVQEILDKDIFLICSDGLFKSLKPKIVKSILNADKDLETKAKKILENCLQFGAEDNISVIIIQ